MLATWPAADLRGCGLDDYYTYGSDQPTFEVTAVFRGGIVGWMGGRVDGFENPIATDAACCYLRK